MMAMRAKRRQAPSPFFLNPLESSCAVGAVPSKKISTLTIAFGQQMWMFHLPFHFMRDNDELKARLFRSNSSAAPAAARLKR